MTTLSQQRTTRRHTNQNGRSTIIPTRSTPRDLTTLHRRNIIKHLLTPQVILTLKRATRVHRTRMNNGTADNTVNHVLTTRGMSHQTQATHGLNNHRGHTAQLQRNRHRILTNVRSNLSNLRHLNDMRLHNCAIGRRTIPPTSRHRGPTKTDSTNHASGALSIVMTRKRSSNSETGPTPRGAPSRSTFHPAPLHTH